MTICRIARPLVVAAAAEGVEPSRPVARHRDRCLRCQAAAARAHAGVRAMRGGSLPVEPPPRGLDDRILAALASGTPPRSAWPSVAVATAATAATASILMWRRWRPA